MPLILALGAPRALGDNQGVSTRITEQQPRAARLGGDGGRLGGSAARQLGSSATAIKGGRIDPGLGDTRAIRAAAITRVSFATANHTRVSHTRVT